MNFIQTAKEVAGSLRQAAGIKERDEILKFIRTAEEIYEEKLKLEREVRELKEMLRFKENLEFRENVLWSNNEKDRGPFCNACWEGDQKAIHLSQNTSLGGVYNCPLCKTRYIVSSQIPRVHTDMDLLR